MYQGREAQFLDKEKLFLNIASSILMENEEIFWIWILLLRSAAHLCQNAECVFSTMLQSYVA